MTTTRTKTAASVLAAIGLAATGCGGGTAGGSGDDTVTIAISADPGSLNPMTAVVTNGLSMNRFAYDSLVHQDASGATVPGLAERWTATTTSAEFTLRKGVTCQDGSELTASDVAAAYNHVADPANSSPLLGLGVPPTAKATADDATRTVKVTSTRPAPFFVEMSRLLPIPCEKGLADPKALARTSDGTGPYRLTEAVPGDHYTYVKRDGYAWGPAGASGAELPGKVVFKVVANESTAVNLMLSGAVQAAKVTGPDRQRLESAKAVAHGSTLVLGELLFNEASGHPTADLPVRRALVGALDLTQIGHVASGGIGKPATNLGEIPPTPCTGDTVAGNVPPYDAARAAAALTEAGWTKSGDGWTKDGKPLTITFGYPGTEGQRIVSAAELAVQQWTALGVKVTTKSMDQATVVTTLASGGWDVAWAPLNVNLPDQLTPFFDGPVPPKGTNFGHIDNPDYQRHVAKAAARPGKEGCADWDAADAALIKRLDVVPFVTDPRTMYGIGVDFRYDGAIVPTSLRRTTR
ncbi:ABC transporter substrate-binding protein [Nonomuraea sp. NN258]|uniref:ABC transporter substrate-binding protein n=1 Tax=Nonomuraea antri TaxID=2730852 RepID=UPI00156A2263|nr:ABC transporter substrate-binding protein [Nonomuraea antri]NRQ38279.1 ABC transporter substrate-binding protein [Nonomuraea antri]